MSYRVLCDENVEPETVGRLETEGKTAAHVNSTLGQGTSDEEIAAFAREEGYVVLTNDDDFLNRDQFPDLTVLYFPDNRVSAYQLSERLIQLQEYFRNTILGNFLLLQLAGSVGK